MNRKAAVCMAAAAVLAVLATGCEAPASAYEKLWSVDIGQEGFERTRTSRTIIWKGDPVNLALIIQPVDQASAPFEGEETVLLRGQEYRLHSWRNSGGGRDKHVAWTSDAYSYEFLASVTNAEVSLDMASPETAERLEANPLTRFEGFELEMDVWRAEYKKGNIEVVINLIPYKYSGHQIWPNFQEDRYTFVYEGDYSYYLEEKITEWENAPPAQDSTPTVAAAENKSVHAHYAMAWQSRLGLFMVLAGAYFYNGESPAEELSFLNADLVRSVSEQMGVDIVPFEGAAKQ